MANLRRLIDLDKINPMYFPSTEMDGLDVVRYLNTLPTVDAVEVVRCKDCKYKKHLHINRFGALNCESTKDDDYCSFGERKTDG